MNLVRGLLLTAAIQSLRVEAAGSREASPTELEFSDIREYALRVARTGKTDGVDTSGVLADPLSPGSAGVAAWVQVQGVTPTKTFLERKPPLHLRRWHWIMIFCIPIMLVIVYLTAGNFVQGAFDRFLPKGQWPSQYGSGDNADKKAPLSVRRTSASMKSVSFAPGPPTTHNCDPSSPKAVPPTSFRAAPSPRGGGETVGAEAGPVGAEGRGERLTSPLGATEAVSTAGCHSARSDVSDTMGSARGDGSSSARSDGGRPKGILHRPGPRFDPPSKDEASSPKKV